MKSPGGGKALLFEKPIIDGKTSAFPVAINTMGSRKRIARALGVNDVADLAQEIQLILKAKPPTDLREGFALLKQGIHLLHARPKHVKEAACQEVVQILDSDQTSTNASPARTNLNYLLARSSHPQMLAEGRWTFHHFSQRAYTRSRKRCSQRWDVSDANLR